MNIEGCSTLIGFVVALLAAYIGKKFWRQKKESDANKMVVEEVTQRLKEQNDEDFFKTLEESMATPNGIRIPESLVEDRIHDDPMFETAFRKVMQDPQGSVEGKKVLEEGLISRSVERKREVNTTESVTRNVESDIKYDLKCAARRATDEVQLISSYKHKGRYRKDIRSLNMIAQKCDEYKEPDKFEEFFEDASSPLPMIYQTIMGLKNDNVRGTAGTDINKYLLKAEDCYFDRLCEARKSMQTSIKRAEGFNNNFKKKEFWMNITQIRKPRDNQRYFPRKG